MEIYFERKKGPSVEDSTYWSDPVTYISVAANTKIPNNNIKVYVPPAPNHFSAKSRSPVNCLIFALYIIIRNERGNPIKANRILSIKKCWDYK